MNNCTSLKKEALERGYNPNFSNLCPSQSWSVSKETTDVTVTRGMDALDRQSIMTLTLLHEFVYEFRGNNTYIIQDRTALAQVQGNLDLRKMSNCKFSSLHKTIFQPLVFRF